MGLKRSDIQIFFWIHNGLGRNTYPHVDGIETLPKEANNARFSRVEIPTPTQMMSSLSRWERVGVRVKSKYATLMELKQVTSSGPIVIHFGLVIPTPT